jgi:hypothetical protein
MPDQKIPRDMFLSFLKDKEVATERIRYSNPERINFYWIKDSYCEFIGYWCGSYGADPEEHFAKPMPFEKYEMIGNKVGSKIV